MKEKTRKQLMKRVGDGYHIDLSPVLIIMIDCFDVEVWMWIDDGKCRYSMIGTIYVPNEYRPHFEPASNFVRRFLPENVMKIIEDFIDGYKRER